MTISDLTDLSSPEPVVKWSEAWWENAKPEVRAHRCKAHRKKRRQMQTSRNRRCKRVPPTWWTRTAGPCKSSAPLGRSNRHDGPCAAEDGYRWDLGVRHLAPHRRPSHICGGCGHPGEKPWNEAGQLLVHGRQPPEAWSTANLTWRTNSPAPPVNSSQ